LPAVPGQVSPHLICVIPDFSQDSNMEQPNASWRHVGRSFY
jgi:hypothetical protein